MRGVRTGVVKLFTFRHLYSPPLPRTRRGALPRGGVLSETLNRGHTEGFLSLRPRLPPLAVFAARFLTREDFRLVHPMYTRTKRFSNWQGRGLETKLTLREKRSLPPWLESVAYLLEVKDTNWTTGANGYDERGK